MKKRILLIEDEKEMNFRLINPLKDLYEVEIAISAEAAIDILKSDSKGFDLIILDVMMAPGPYTMTETDKGMETGWVLYREELQRLPTRIIIWTRNSYIFGKPWGPNVKEKLDKSSDEYQLVNAAKKHIGE
jgi:CheY-like chemotaxis protein